MKLIEHWGGELSPELSRVIEEVDHFVRWIFQHHDCHAPRRAKVIHDGVWGTNKYSKFEVAIINSPLIQRLRNVHQTAYTFFTFPSSQHSRFDHTLGVTAQVGELYSALGEKFENDPDKSALLKDLQTLRSAALLHDCGHGPLSHTSEEVYKHYPEIQLLRSRDPFKQASPHEALSSLIVLSENFQTFFREIKKSCHGDVDENLLVEAIVGFVSQPDQRFKIDFLNGPFDADKLDYLFRDGHFSGIPMHIDLDRLWYAIDINWAKEQRRLTVDWGGAASLEQIMFAKMTLYPAVYHHHKVRACDCMFKGVTEYLKSLEIPLNKIIGGDDESPLFSRATHFLYFDDYRFFELLAKVPNDEKLHQLVHNLQYRRLLKRCVVISMDTIEDVESLDNLLKFRDEAIEVYREIAQLILAETKLDLPIEEVWVDCPHDPNFNSADDTWISPLDNGDCSFNLTSFFSIKQWADQYKHRKWRGHVFFAQGNMLMLLLQRQIRFLKKV